MATPSHAGGSLPDRAGERRSLRWVLGLTVGYMAIEVAGGIWSGSLALLADAGHMLTDAASIALALGALWVARRPPTTERTFGFGRVEILAALVNGLALWGIVVWIAVEAVSRFRTPEQVLAGPMMAIAAGGLVVNTVAVAILHRRAGRKDTSLNLRGALLHVVGDLLGSVGALAAGAVIFLTGWVPADAVASLVIAGLILVGATRLVRDAVHVLLEGAPTDLDVRALIQRVCALDGVEGVHDLHVWTITSGYPSLAAHVVCTHGVDRDLMIARINRVLREQFSIEHTTIQMEAACPPDHGEPMARPVATIE